MLRKRGHQVVTADCFAAALAALKEADVPFDLLISDIELPDGDGLQLMREIKASEPMTGIAMSGFGAEEDLRQSREAGFFDHLTKPIDLKRLDNAIRSAAAGAASRDADPTTSAALQSQNRRQQLRSIQDRLVGRARAGKFALSRVSPRATFSETAPASPRSTRGSRPPLPRARVACPVRAS